jgi:hypothetical protein
MGRPLSFAESKAALVLEAKADLLANIDADDVNEPDRLDLQVEYMNRTPAVAAASCHFQRVDEQASSLGAPTQLPLAHGDIVNKLLDPSPLCNPAAIMRKHMLQEVGGFRALALAEDYDLWLRLAHKFELGNIDKVCLKYRIRPNSMVNQAKRTDSLRRMTAEVAAESGSQLFGLSSDQLFSLFLRQSRFALPMILQIARHLDRTQPGRKRLRSKSFTRAIRNLVNRKDHRTMIVVHGLRAMARE